jgi:hypothetical protein
MKRLLRKYSILLEDDTVNGEFILFCLVIFMPLLALIGVLVILFNNLT